MEPLKKLDTLTAWVATAMRPKLRLCGAEHPVSPEMLDRFAAGSSPQRERAVVLLHLLTRCPSCSRRLGHLWPLEERQEPEDAYDRALDRGFERALQALRFRAPAAQGPENSRRSQDRAPAAEE